MYCKRLTRKFQFTIRPNARCIGAGVFAPPVFFFSQRTGAKSAFPDTSLDSGLISAASAMDITRLNCSPVTTPPGPFAGVFFS